LSKDLLTTLNSSRQEAALPTLHFIYSKLLKGFLI
jgi:hypothetical protein